MKTCRKCAEEFDSRACPFCARARIKAWRIANPERAAASMQKWRAANPARKRELALAAYHRRMERDSEAIRLYRRSWAKTPKGVLSSRLRGHRRRGAKTDKTYAAILYKDPCSYCGAYPVEIDHIIPLASQGNGEWDNLTAACRSCNASKNDRDLLRFLSERIPA